jgi:hypothetical protein
VSRVQLSGGAYEAHSVIASAQRCLNLYAEQMPQAQGEPSAYAYYPTPGLRLVGVLPTGPVRGLKLCSNGQLYAVGGATVYALEAAYNAVPIGTITTGRTTPVGMAENGLNLVIVDGTGAGWTVPMTTTNRLENITSPNFRGGDRVDYLDTFLVNNVPGTPQFQSSDSLAVTYDPLFFANKQSYSDLLVTLCVAKREIWLIGQVTTEVWYNSGAPDFPFQEMAAVFIQHGCVAKYSVATIDNSVYWLSQTREGHGIVVAGSGYQARRISTFAIEAEFSTYATITDAIGYTYQLGGHMWFALAFPTADKTWAYDISTGLWHELAWIDNNGVEHRHRANCAALAYNGDVVCGDWQNGNLYAFDLAMFTDVGQPIKRVRSFPHMIADGKRVFYRQFLADIEAGNPGGDSFVSLPADDLVREDGTLFLREDGTDLLREAGASSGLLSLRWSDDRGHTYGNPVTQFAGATGAYLTSLQWQRLGMARDRVFEISWSIAGFRALQGAWIDAKPGVS